MMNTKTLLIGSALLAITLASCGQPVAAPTSPAVGTWSGKWGSGSASPSNNYAFIVQSDGSLKVYDGTIASSTNQATGTWNLSGGSFSSTYIYMGGGKISVAASISGNKIIGTWGSETSTTNGGTFYLDRQ